MRPLALAVVGLGAVGVVHAGSPEYILASKSNALAADFTKQVTDLAVNVMQGLLVYMPADRVKINLDVSTDDDVSLSGMSWQEADMWSSVIDAHRYYWAKYISKTKSLWRMPSAQFMYQAVAKDAHNAILSRLPVAWHQVSVSSHAARHGDMVGFGGGAGFGFQLLCGDQVLFTMGGGLGSGADGVHDTNGDGGGGSGGGWQVPSSPGSPALAVNFGGGGGGSVLPSVGFSSSADADEQGSFEEARVTVNRMVRECAGGVSFAGGGGGGHGFTTSDGGYFAFGGGFGFTLSATIPREAGTDNATAMDAGPLAGDTIGTTIGDAARACRKQCVPAAGGGSISIFSCTCTCQRSKFMSLGLQWASNMKCE